MNPLFSQMKWKNSNTERQVDVLCMKQRICQQRLQKGRKGTRRTKAARKALQKRRQGCYDIIPFLAAPFLAPKRQKVSHFLHKETRIQNADRVHILAQVLLQGGPEAGQHIRRRKMSDLSRNRGSFRLFREFAKNRTEKNTSSRMARSTEIMTLSTKDSHSAKSVTKPAPSTRKHLLSSAPTERAPDSMRWR